MILSGFLMAYHYGTDRSIRSNSPMRMAGAFWTKRWFRIAPLFYILLIVSLLINTELGQNRDLVAAAWPSTATSTERYTDNSFYNIFIHFSFIFGMIPEFSFRTPLPDWSIGLEMQFYLIFPFLMMAIKLWGNKFLIAVSVFCIFSLWLFQDFFELWPMPAFLPMKFPLFAIGMMLAFGKAENKMPNYFKYSLLVAALIFLLKRTPESFFGILLVFFIFNLVSTNPIFKSTAIIFLKNTSQRILSTPIAKFLGETSYAVYLLHLLVLIPIAGQLSKFTEYQALASPVRALVCFATTAILVYPASWVLYNFVEQPGIRSGKYFIKRIAAS